RTLKVAVKNALGNTSGTVDLIIKYDGTKPGIPGNLGSESVNSDNATITWGAASDATSGIDTYRVYRSTTNSFSSAADVGTSSSLSKQVTGLSACTTYYFWVKARDVAGNEGDPQSSPLSFTTSGCSTGGSGESGSGSGSGGSSSGGGGGSSCEVTFSVPTNLYEGDSVAVKVSGKSYANGHFRVTPTGFPTHTIEKSGLAQSSWSGNYTVPKAGLTLKFVFGTDSCTASTSRTVSPKSSKPAAAAPAAKESDDEDEDDDPDTSSATLNEPAPVVSLGTTTISFSMDKVSELMAFAGFNADNVEQRGKIEALITGTGLVEMIHVVPGVGEGNYQIEIVLTLVNRSNAGTLKVVQQVPKSFAETAGLIESNYPMTILKDDPLVQFEISDLSEGQTVEVRLKSKEQYSLSAANAKVESLKGESTPPLLFASGTAKPAEGSGGLASISGLVGAVGSSAPFVLGFVLVLGLIFVSIRVVRGSVEGSDNPILRSASRIGERNGPLRNPSANGIKKWKNDKSEDAD
ncbi:MAG: fibronectin type III domain-containing protein, partial [archaeon]